MEECIQNLNDLACNLKLVRKHVGISQQKIANKLHIERTTYSYYERGKTAPDIFMLIKLAKLFNVELSLLVSKNITDESLLESNHSY